MIRKYEVKIPFKKIIEAFFLKEDYKKKLAGLFSKFFPNRKLLLTASGSCAIFMALKDIESRYGTGYVITSNYSCKAIPRAIIRAGFNPIFVDVDKNMSIDSKLLVKAIKENKNKIKAIIAWHPEGFTFNKELFSIAKENKIPLIEDCASSLALVEGKLVGGEGNYSIFSFRTGKLVHGGGGVLISKEVLKINIKKKNAFIVFYGLIDLLIRRFNNWTKPKAILDHFFDKIGNYGMPNKEAFLVYSQVKELESKRKKRLKNYNFILKEINNEGILRLERKKVVGIPTSLILLKNNRNEFVRFMKKFRILVSMDHSHINSDSFDGKVYDYLESKNISKKICHIPVHEYLRKKDVFLILKALKKWNSLEK